jgi:hypothetical protein
MIWAALIIAIVLLFLFPKKMGLVAGLIIATFLAVVVYIKVDEGNRKSQLDAVSIVIEYGTSNCSFAEPVNVVIKNGSGSTVESVKWSISAYQAGYSANVIDDGKYYGTNQAPYESRQALAPNESISLCYEVPTLKSDINVSGLSWEGVNKQVLFE